MCIRQVYLKIDFFFRLCTAVGIILNWFFFRKQCVLIIHRFANVCFKVGLLKKFQHFFRYISYLRIYLWRQGKSQLVCLNSENIWDILARDKNINLYSYLINMRQRKKKLICSLIIIFSRSQKPQVLHARYTICVNMMFTLKNLYVLGSSWWK